MELARLREAAGQAQDWHSQPIDAPPFHFIQRQHPRVVVNKFEENNEEHRLMKKTRANWTLPSMNQQIPTATTIGLPQPTPEEMHLVKEAHPTIEEHQQLRKLRMVTHYAKGHILAPEKPPMPQKSRNPRSFAKGSMVSDTHQHNPLTENSPERHGERGSSIKLAAENMLSFDKKRRDIR